MFVKFLEERLLKEFNSVVIHLKDGDGMRWLDAFPARRNSPMRGDYHVAGKLLFAHRPQRGMTELLPSLFVPEGE